MMKAPRRFARTRALGLSLAGVAAIAAACAVDTPDRVTGAAQSSATRESSAANSDQAYFAFQVDRSAEPSPGNAAPRYPTLLRSARVTGEVIAQFVVGTDGRPDMSSFKVVRSSHALFTQAVKASLANWTYRPAVIHGHPARQLIQQPFQFRLSNVPDTNAVPVR